MSEDKGPVRYTLEQVHSWRFLHEMAVEAVTEAGRHKFVHFIWYILAKHPCLPCRLHTEHRYVDFPIQDVWSSPLGCAKWSWEFHNSVNERIGNPLYPWSDFVAEYL